MINSISILGSTGSIGTQTLSVCDKTGIKVDALAANSNYKLLGEQVKKYHPKKVCIFNDKYYNDLKREIEGENTKIVCNMDGLCEIASDKISDKILNSVVGMVGLKPTLAALNAGNTVALANKETLVAGGNLVMPLSKEKNVPVLPVDSEHSAIFQCLQGNKNNKIKKILLTASGGPFFGKTATDLENITPEQALKHPNWNMGAKVTIDSASLMNKGLESVEAKWLFDLDPKQIEVVVHRQSVVHSAVMYEDNSVIAQLGVPDMRIPIQYALTYPKRIESPVAELDLFKYKDLTFEKPDRNTFKCLDMAFFAMEKKKNYCVIMNAANEIAVRAFLDKKIKFMQIPDIIQSAFENVKIQEADSFEKIIETDKETRRFVESKVESGRI